MLALPPIAPRVGHTWSGRLGRDYYVRIASNDYSVDPSVIGQPVQVRADLSWVRAHAGGRLVAEHVRSWGTRATITDPAHKATAAVLRERFGQVRPSTTGACDLHRDLADYDRAFGISFGASDGQVA